MGISGVPGRRAGEDLSGIVSALPFIPTRPLTANINVAAGSTDNPSTESIGREMPYRGWLGTMFTQWEDGANQLVGVQVRHGPPSRDGRVIVPVNPEDDYISLNNIHRNFDLWVPAREGQAFTLEVQNRDSGGHSVPFILQAVRFTQTLASILPPELLPPPPRTVEDE